MELQVIEQKIYEIRDHKIMLDFDLAELYGVETKRLNEQVKRNLARFPKDFMFRLTEKEWGVLRSQFATASQKKRNISETPYAFTEQGVSMLSSVLRSDTAIKVNIAIMRTFVFMRQYALTHKELTEKLKELETKYDKQFRDVYEALNFLLKKDQVQTEHQNRKRIGFKRETQSE